MPLIAVIDATHHTVQAGPDLVVAGLTLLERALRLVQVAGCDRAIVLAREAQVPLAQSIVDAHKTGLDITLETATDAIATKDDVLWLRSSTIYDRGLVNNCRDQFQAADATPRTHTMCYPDSSEPADVAAFDAAAWQELVSAKLSPDVTELGDALSVLEARGLTVTRGVAEHWQERIATREDAVRAADRLWSGCRKDIDGIVSRHLNRYISLAISRTIASTGIKPNHISIATFTMGIIAGLLAAWGGYAGFALAGIVYQINSVVDGVDGELARVKYEFSVLGEWLDTLSDDFSDAFFYIGLGIGAWRTVDTYIFGMGPELWLYLGGIALLGKVASMAIYYRWLIANKRGDLLAFQWSFEAPTEQRPSLLTRLLQNLKYVTKKDFIVLVAMIMGLAGILPWFLLILGPGNFIVFISVAIQEVKNRQVAALEH